MTTRAQQYQETRRRIIDAAVDAFSELGFHGASTREIAARAGTNQGLITYHFRSKDELWRAAAERIFSGNFIGEADVKERAQAWVPAIMRFAGAGEVEPVAADADKPVSDEATNEIAEQAA